jgi:hypothetical protein
MFRQLKSFQVCILGRATEIQLEMNINVMLGGRFKTQKLHIIASNVGRRRGVSSRLAGMVRTTSGSSFVDSNVAKEEIVKQFPTERTEFIILRMHL